ncbi:hypothetical protein PUN28_012688 [Cardiocondyla obscurior]|uniref:PB1 domain-containing protein n=1 Tax=Cardiocondyla obscurior TaxID=286306 RepID=A0AAW2FI46_9HYME
MTTISTAMTTMLTALHDSEEYYCFRVRESVGCEIGDDENIVIPCSPNFDLEKLRTELWKQFGVPTDRRIFYIDDDGDDVPIDSECEFHEALELAKNAFIANKSIPLIVGSFHVPTCSDDEQCLKTNKIYSKGSRNINGNLVSEPNLDKQKHSTCETPNQRKKNMKCDESKEKQTKLEDAAVPKELNTTLRCNSDTVAPSWFTEYMEVMKKDMISIITNEVIRNVTEVLNKRMDSFVHPSLKQLGQSRSQSYSALSKRHSRCSSDSNEKAQKRIRSQDEEQSSDTSIERVEEPQHASTFAEDSQKTRSMINTISQEVVKEMTEMLNKLPTESRSQSHFPSSKRLTRHSEPPLSGKRKTELQDVEISSVSSDDALVEHTYKPRNRSLANIADITRQKKYRDIIEDYKRHEKAFQKVQNNNWIAYVVDNISIDNDKKQSTQNNTREDDLLSKQFDSACDKIPGMIENELRMSCSITGHQLLDKGRNKCTGSNNTDIDKTCFWLCDEEDDDAFEIVQMPSGDSSVTNKSRREEHATEQRRHDNNRDSPSFEILSEPSSPIYRLYPIQFNDQHFSLNEKRGEQQSSRFMDTNLPAGSVFTADINSKICNKNESADTAESISADLEKRSGGAYSFVAETLPVQDSCYLKSCSEERSGDRQKNPRDDVSCNASSKYDDVRNSHTSYLNVRIDCDSKMQCSCQSQTDLNDFTQSFHSHTTSVTDATDIHTEAYDNNKCNDRVPTINEQKSATIPRRDHDACGSSGCTKESKTSETQRSYGGCTEEIKTSGRQNSNGSDNFSKRFSDSHSSPRSSSVDPPHKSGRSNPSESKKPSVDTPDNDLYPHIVPEILFNAVTIINHYCENALKTLNEIRTQKVSD